MLKGLRIPCFLWGSLGHCRGTGVIPLLAQWLRIQHCHSRGGGHSWRSDRIRDQEFPYATGVAKKREREKAKPENQIIRGVPVVAQRKLIWLVSMRMRVQSLALLNGLRIQRCCELWGRSQTRLRSDVAVAVVEASSYSSDSNFHRPQVQP